jgi:hypothetical protein
MAEPTESYEDFVSQILRPTNISSLKSPVKYEKVSIIIYKDGAQEELEFENIYPFYTVSDLSTMIYAIKESKEEFHPQNQCLLKKTPTGKFINLKYLIKNNKASTIEFVSPLELAASGKANPKFVDLEGNPQIQDITSHDQMLLETVLFKKVSDVYTIHLFLYSDILKTYPGLRPINRVDWEGIFKVYFPQADKAHEDGSLSDEQAAYAPIRVQRFIERQRIVERLDQSLTEEEPLRRIGESARGGEPIKVRNLRFTWDKPNSKSAAGYQPFRLESVFYDMPVSKEMPYMRYYPTANSATPISKVHVEGPLNIPTMEDPQILQKWSQERPLLPEEEFIMAKLLIRSGSGSVNPLYGSLFIFQDGNAMFAVQPNTDSKSLSKEADLQNLVPVLNKVMKSIPGLQPALGKALPPIPAYSPATVNLTDAYIILPLLLEKEGEQITQRSLSKVLPFFRPFFQITSSPIKEQNPIAFLRYKGVNNFQTPSRDFQFLIRVMDLQKMSGQTSLPALVKFYKEEFDVSDEIANRRVSTFLNDREKYDMTNPETLEYTQSENPGIDIAIFGKHPFYTFHIYRVDSKITLERIKILLSLLISISPAAFSQHSAEVLAEEDAEAAASAEAEATEDLGEDVSPEADAPAEAKSLMVAATALNAPAEQEIAMIDDGMGDIAFGDEEEFPAQDLKTLAQADSPEEKPSAPPKTKGKVEPKAKEEDEDDEITDISQIKQQPSRIYFRKRLQFYDRKLFSYSKTHPSLKKYPSMCAANALKQPTVMTEGEFERMKDTYSEDVEAGRVIFKEYPIKKGSAGAGAAAVVSKKSTNKTEIITSLRYGSNLLPGQANIFICSEYWCRNDEIVILRDDFIKTVDRKGKPKAKNTCPFCKGGLVQNRDMTIDGESVIQRLGKGKEADDKKHLFINFLRKTPHPQGLYLPCCFISDHLIEDRHPAYEPLTKGAQSIVGEPVVPALAADVQAAKQEVPFLQKPKQEEIKVIAVDYKSTLTDIFSESMTDRPYIVGAEKLPLELTKKGPQIGIVPKSVDTYFTQDSLGTATKPGLVVQDHTVWKLMIDNATKKPKATGFFRMAAENNKRNQPEAFLAAIAPYFGENSAAAMKRRILELVQPNIFLALNYGNFLFDFYDPMTPDPKQIGIIREFAQKRLLVDFLVGTPKELVIRAWKGFMAFTAFMGDTTKVKEYRQFANMLALPNLFQWEDFSDIQRSNGILFIVLEVGHDNSVEVRCPPYGVSKTTLNCDVAFILHYASGIWEPLFHIRSDQDVSEITTVFTRDTYASWPSIVKQRVKEFENLCHSSGLGMYTDSPSVKATSLMPLSVAMNIDSDIYGIMRDIYNHVSFVIYKDTESLVLVPVIDDGTVYPSTRIVVEWKSLYKKLATVDVVKAFYAAHIQPALESDVQKMSYEPGTVYRLDKTDDKREYVNALQLKLGLHVPVKASAGEGGEQAEEMAEGSEISWSIDRKIAFGSLTADASLTVDHKEFEEIYQHLRFSFANWFSLAPPTFKTEINKIIFKDGGPNIDLPLYEKRQRLSIKLKKEIEGWLDSSVSRPNRQPSLKRIDCRVVVEEGGCKDRCVWKGAASEAGSQVAGSQAAGKCLLHTPERFDLGVKEVSATDLLINRLIEELIRFPLKRDELLNQRVSQYVKLSEAFRSENQYIVPEDLPAWSELLRMDWTKKSESKYIEEYTAIEPQDFVAEDAVTSFQTKDIPVLATMFGPDFFFIEEGSGSITKIIEDMGIPGTDLEAIGQTPDAPIVEPDIATYIAKELKYSFYQLLYAPGNPVPEEPLSVKLQLNVKTTAPFLIIVKLPDERVGVISKSPDTPEVIEISNLPPKVRVSVTKMFTKV